MPSTSHTGAAYVPLIPSPLNPRSQEEAALALRRRSNSRKMHKSIGMSSAQRLLRHNAAEAWRSQALRREVMLYERRAIEAITARQVKTATLRPDRRPIEVTPLSRLGSLRYELEPGDGGTDGKQEEHENQEEEEEVQRQQQQQQYMFHMPDLGFLTPRRVVLAISRARMRPWLQVNSFCAARRRSLLGHEQRNGVTVDEEELLETGCFACLCALIMIQQGFVYERRESADTPLVKSGCSSVYMAIEYM
ncbi:Uncharacterized protein TPAR_03487 [Tolypocladium paradoxum]|uniref:Uncharacterized protein n=1 Tax=Tolypocladium paradoxum TaxID=94208 RepID=A0A2S4L1I9_9HYPO|nr:Uncharacterized protein TPAR_03487 [Tolypocladium paradoxum]